MEFLTEKSLVKFLLEFIDRDGVHNKQFMTHKFRPNFVSHRNKLVVEFDGYLHYTKAKTILNDARKDNIAKQEGYNVIRIPYFVQLDSNVMNYLFFKYMSQEPFDYVKYPHGFIDQKAILPADFCSLGVKRFYQDLERFCFIQDRILQSMDQKKDLDRLEVYHLN